MVVQQVKYIGKNNPRAQRDHLGEDIDIGYLVEEYVYIFEIAFGWVGAGVMTTEEWLVVGPCQGEEQSLLEFLNGEGIYSFSQR